MRSKVKIDDRLVKTLKAPTPDGKPRFIWDSELVGFGVLLSGKENSKSYQAQCRTPSGDVPRYRFAAVGEISAKEARDEAARIIHKMRLGEWVSPKKAAKDRVRGKKAAGTVLEALDAYITDNKQLRPKTIRSYRQAVSWLKWDGKKLADITREECVARHAAIAEGIADEGRYNGMAAANAAFRVLRAVWNHVKDNEPEGASALPEKNPVKFKRKTWFKVPRRATYIPGDRLGEWFAGVQTLENIAARDFLTLQMYLGSRLNETRQLLWKNVDFANRTITFPADDTKTDTQLALPMTPQVERLLKARKALGVPESGLVFEGRHVGKPLYDANDALAEVQEKTGIKATHHDFRRGVATYAEAIGIGVFTIKAILNHANAENGDGVTAGYVRHSTGSLREPMEKLHSHIDKLAGVGKKKRKKVDVSACRSRHDHLWT